MLEIASYISHNTAHIFCVLCAKFTGALFHPGIEPYDTEESANVVVVDNIHEPWLIAALIAAGKPTAVSNAQNLTSKASNKTDTSVNTPTLIIHVGTTCVSALAPVHGNTHPSNTVILVL